MKLTIEHQLINGSTENVDFNLLMKVQNLSYQNSSDQSFLTLLGKLILFLVAIAAVYMSLTVCFKRREVQVIREIREASTTRLDEEF